MRWMASIVCVFALCASAPARVTRIWTTESLLAESDLAVCAIPTVTRLTGRIDVIMGFNSDEIETTFQVLTQAKGPPGIRQLVLHHYRYSRGAQPNLVAAYYLEFHPADHQQYRLYLKQEADGRYEPVSGQYDAALGIRLPDGGACFAPSGGVEKERATEAAEKIFDLCHAADLEDLPIGSQVAIRGTLHQEIDSALIRGETCRDRIARLAFSESSPSLVACLSGSGAALVYLVIRRGLQSRLSFILCGMFTGTFPASFYWFAAPADAVHPRRGEP
ncbi:MAG: hypothetical protein U1F35_21890 [Steroidobacteraceae bacterium]